MANRRQLLRQQSGQRPLPKLATDQLYRCFEPLLVFFGSVFGVFIKLQMLILANGYRFCGVDCQSDKMAQLLHQTWPRLPYRGLKSIDAMCRLLLGCECLVRMLSLILADFSRLQPFWPISAFQSPESWQASLANLLQISYLIDISVYLGAFKYKRRKREQI